MVCQCIIPMNLQACLKNEAVSEKIYYLYFTFLYTIIFIVLCQFINIHIGIRNSVLKRIV